MKKYTIVGIQTNSGVIKSINKPWTNYTLFCTVNDERKINNLVGQTVDFVKVSERVMNEFSESYGTQIIGLTVSITFDKATYNGVDKLIVSEIVPIEILGD